MHRSKSEILHGFEAIPFLLSPGRLQLYIIMPAIKC